MKSIKIVIIKYVNYDGTFQPEHYYFATDNDVKKDDFVLCDTRYGCVLGIVCDVYSTLLDLILNVDQISPKGLKECSTLDDSGFKNLLIRGVKNVD